MTNQNSVQNNVTLPVPPFDPNQVYDIPIKSIYQDEDFNSRGAVDPISVIDLAKDIKEHGLVSPIIVQPWHEYPGKDFRLVAGYRRLKAHQVNGSESIRVLIREGLSDFDARLLNLKENVHRQQLNIRQEAHALEPFKRAGWSEPDVAKKVGLSRGWVQVRYMLLELPEEIQNEAAAGILTNAQVRQCFTLNSPEEQYEFVRKIKDAKLLGKKRDVKAISANKTKIRGLEELLKMQDNIREFFGHNMATKILGWASGYVNDFELHTYLKEYAEENGKHYPMPPEFENYEPESENQEVEVT